MTDSLDLLLPAMVSATVTFTAALLFRTPRQLALYASLGLGTLFILAVSKPNVDPAALFHLVAVVLFVIPAAGGLLLGVAVKVIYLLWRKRVRANKGHA